MCQSCSRVNADVKENLEFFVLFKVCGPLAQAARRRQSMEQISVTSSSSSPRPRVDCRSTSQRPGLVWEGLERQYIQVCPPQTPPPPQVLGLRSTIKNIKKFKKLIMTKTMRLGGPLTLAQKRRKSPNSLRPIRQRCLATAMGQIPAQWNGMTMPLMGSNKQLTCMKPNNKDTKNLKCGTLPAKVAVAR